ncbi:hypothetical protein AB0J21_18795 [Streptomyces sp. NPDC049954]|uniref:hypothetical protein n=1 Tax=Streptomyces sp. NPDC049954 TaxID=3155779 RepID=UPI00343CBEBA
MPVAERPDRGPRAAQPHAAPSMSTLLASCAAANAVSTPPAAPRSTEENTRGHGADEGAGDERERRSEAA